MDIKYVIQTPSPRTVESILLTDLKNGVAVEVYFENKARLSAVKEHVEDIYRIVGDKTSLDTLVGLLGLKYPIEATNRITFDSKDIIAI